MIKIILLFDFIKCKLNRNVSVVVDGQLIAQIIDFALEPIDYQSGIELFVHERFVFDERYSLRKSTSRNRFLNAKRFKKKIRP